MNYQNLYVNLLIKHGTEDKPLIGYYERHHIVPLSLGGDDTAYNLVYLSGRAHFIAHWLLYKIHKNTAMATAFYGMCDLNRRPERYKPSSRVYELAKKAFSENNHMKTAEHRLRASVSASNQWSNEDSRSKILVNLMPMFDDKTHPMYMKGKTGDAHPRSRRINTPLGIFGSVRDAGKAFNIAHNVISRRCKSNLPKYAEYSYLD